MAEPGRTRRSSRPLVAPSAPAIGDPGQSRSETRRRRAEASAARPAVVWGRPVEEQTSTDAAPAVAAADAPVHETPETTASAPAQLSRRARRIIATPTVAISVISDSEPSPEALTPVAAEAPAATDDVTPPAMTAEAAESFEPTQATESFELIEPVVEAEPIVDETIPMSAEGSQAPVDEFEAAARLFSFTGETPIMRVVPDEAPEAPAPAAHVASRGRSRRGASFRRVAAASFTLGVMGIVGLLAVGMTTPAEAVAAATRTDTITSAPQQLAGDVVSKGQIQAYVAPSEIQNAQVSRSGNYQTAKLVDLAGAVGISNFSSSVFTNNTRCPIQWPFAVGVTMSYGFGMRDGVMHEGVDFTPGDGSHIQAIADGVVRISTDSGGAFGVTIVIDHVVDGQLVSSRYGHMQYGSRQVQVGDHVTVGQYIGRTGDTGRSFGAHTHVEILAGGTTAIDPLPWFRTHATC
ncbi:peptidoglycan DD-metalloendopeptidase family protein [Microbacterium sp. CJ88]|uniref:M23 family metallopeptidase n=1 Tax=Microbacterium sp. CJ88 TaxID=3445672 RepID=UPI003F65E6AA